jgi:hypothetical protein
MSRGIVCARDSSRRFPRHDIAAMIGHERGFTLDSYSGGKGFAVLQRDCRAGDVPRLGHRVPRTCMREESLSESERERQRLNFRRRLDPASKQPEKSHVAVRILNSPFTIWLLSAVLLTVGSAYVTGYQKCEADAGRLITNYYKDQIELMRRLQYIRSRVARASNVEEVRRIIETQPFVYDDLKTRTTRDLLFEVHRTERLIDFTKDKPLIDMMGKRSDGSAPRFTPSDLNLYGTIAVGELPDELTDADVNDRGKRLVDFFASLDLSDLRGKNVARLWSKCNFFNSLLGVPLRGTRKVIEADASLPIQ